MKRFKAKRQGLGLEVQFVETEAKAAAKDCGGKGKNTRQYWDSLWKK